ncbi:DUF58 domain-containing protein [bacterium]
MTRQKIIDPGGLVKISSLSLRAKMIVEGVMSGIHASTYKGVSTEFSHHREYSPGDELRFIDWRVYAKSDKYFIKQFVEDTTVRAHILLDVSTSMNYPFADTGNISKLEYAKTFAAAICYLLILQHDSVGLVTFDEKLREIIPVEAGLSHLHLIFKTLENIQAVHKTDINNSILEFGNFLKRRSLIIIISDFLANTDRVWSVLKYLAVRKHEVVLFHILDPSELSLEGQGEIEFQDIETKQKRVVYIDDLRDSYSKVTADFITFYRHHCQRIGIDYALFTCEMPFQESLSSYLIRRNKKR